MPKPLVATENLRKHITTAEREARAAAEESVRTGRRATLPAPEWLSVEGKKVFEDTKRKLRGSGILETADAELLAMYSDAVARYQLAVKTLKVSNDAGAKSAQAWSRLALAYAEKMGISATGRARLAKKKAEAPAVDDMEALLGDITDYVNGDGQ